MSNNHNRSLLTAVSALAWIAVAPLASAQLVKDSVSSTGEPTYTLSNGQQVPRSSETGGDGTPDSSGGVSYGDGTYISVNSAGNTVVSQNGEVQHESTPSGHPVIGGIAMPYEANSKDGSETYLLPNGQHVLRSDPSGEAGVIDKDGAINYSDGTRISINDKGDTVVSRDGKVISTTPGPNAGSFSDKFAGKPNIGFADAKPIEKSDWLKNGLDKHQGVKDIAQLSKPMGVGGVLNGPVGKQGDVTTKPGSVAGGSSPMDSTVGTKPSGSSGSKPAGAKPSDKPADKKPSNSASQSGGKNSGSNDSGSGDEGKKEGKDTSSSEGGTKGESETGASADDKDAKDSADSGATKSVGIASDTSQDQPEAKTIVDRRVAQMNGEGRDVETGQENCTAEHRGGNPSVSDPIENHSNCGAQMPDRPDREGETGAETPIGDLAPVPPSSVGVLDKIGQPGVDDSREELGQTLEEGLQNIEGVTNPGR